LEHRDPREEVLQVRWQEVVAPLDRRAQRALARCRELEGKRQSVEVATDLDCTFVRHEIPSNPPRALDEQLDRVVFRQWIHCVLAFVVEPKRCATGRKDLCASARFEQRCHHWRGREDVLEIVEQEQSRPVCDLLERLCAHRPGNRRADELRQSE
jgi:hypothetical protein